MLTGALACLHKNNFGTSACKSPIAHSKMVTLGAGIKGPATKCSVTTQCHLGALCFAQADLLLHMQEHRCEPCRIGHGRMMGLRKKMPLSSMRVSSRL